MTKTKCPHCGNTNQDKIEDNGCEPGSFNYALLCVNRVEPRDRSWTHVEPEPDQIDAEGKVSCGYQWSPNEES